MKIKNILAIIKFNSIYLKEHYNYINASITYEKEKRNKLTQEKESEFYTKLDSSWRKSEAIRLELITLLKELNIKHPLLAWLTGQSKTKIYKLYFEEYSDQLYKDELDYVRGGDKDKLHNMTTDAMRANHYSTLLNEIYIQKSLKYTQIILLISLITLYSTYLGIKP